MRGVVRNCVHLTGRNHRVGVEFVVDADTQHKVRRFRTRMIRDGLHVEIR